MRSLEINIVDLCEIAPVSEITHIYPSQWLYSYHLKAVLTLLMLETEYSGLGGHYHVCWCLGS